MSRGPSGLPGHPLSERSEVLLRGKIFDVVASELTLPSGVAQSLWVIEHPGAVAIAPVTDAGELLLVRQYRHAAREVTLEIPAGRLEHDESPLAAARRELAEETGRSAENWRELVTFLPAPGFCSERIVLFEARGLAAGGDRTDAPRPDADEDLEVLSLPIERVLEVARDGKTLLAAALLLLRR
jgi:ADP-ribose pyrophosphatase